MCVCGKVLEVAIAMESDMRKGQWSLTIWQRETHDVSNRNKLCLDKSKVY